MSLFIVVLHLMLCVLLILIILLQPGKGGDVAAAFGAGGGSSNVFGPRGPANLLSQATTVVAVLFMVTSITLAIQSNQRAGNDADTEQEVLIDDAEGFLPAFEEVPSQDGASTPN
jgi:preprotein translocase subunit SecG